MAKNLCHSKKLDVVKKMPPLHHSFGQHEFRLMDSEVVNWLIHQPSVLQYLFDLCARTCLHYDPVSGTWRGVNYK